jgi:hypothetical protein
MRDLGRTISWMTAWIFLPVAAFTAASTATPDPAPLTVSVRLGDRMIVDAAQDLTWADVVPPNPVNWSPDAAPGSAQAWVARLNAKNDGQGYGGHHDWRLATGDGSAAFAPVNAANELGSLFYTVLGNPPYVRVTHLEPFTALASDRAYWSGSRFAPGATKYAWGFNTGNGRQFRDAFAKYSAIAVRTGH